MLGQEGDGPARGGLIGCFLFCLCGVGVFCFGLVLGVGVFLWVVLGFVFFFW